VTSAIEAATTDRGVALDVRPLTATIGAEIHGVDISRPLDPVRVTGTRAALVHRNRVNISRGEVTGAASARFASQDLRAVHPMVRVHPETGRRGPFVNPAWTTHVEEPPARRAATCPPCSTST
jgi:alpha-ketoglutarate-dependent taurine dioxygenase